MIQKTFPRTMHHHNNCIENDIDDWNLPRLLPLPAVMTKTWRSRIEGEKSKLQLNDESCYYTDSYHSNSDSSHNDRRLWWSFSDGTSVFFRYQRNILGHGKKFWTCVHRRNKNNIGFCLTLLAVFIAYRFANASTQKVVRHHSFLQIRHSHNDDYQD